MLHDGLWALPASPKTREDFEWLAEEIEERGGSVLLWQAQSLGTTQDATIVDRFRGESLRRFGEIAEAAEQLDRLVRRRSVAPRLVEQAMVRLRALERALHAERRRDYFRAAERPAAEAAVRKAMDAARARLDVTTGERRSRAVGD